MHVTITEGGAKPVNSTDVARRAGVSRSTVSNILNGNDARFPESTRERVRRAAIELDYQPSLAGRSLVSGRSDTIVILLPNTTFGSNLQDAVDSMMVGTRKVSGNVVVRFAGTTSEATVAAVLALRPLALIDLGVLTIEDRDRLEARGTIVIPRIHADFSSSSDGGVAQTQARALLERGPRPLWFAGLVDDRGDPYGPGRFAALGAWCEEMGLPGPRQIRLSLTVASAVEALIEVLEAGTPAGIACYNDDTAIALLAAARELHVTVPYTVSLVGVDNTATGQLWSPTLTTVDTDLRGLVGAMAAELAARLSGDPAALDIVMPAPHLTLIKGGTT